MPDNLPSWLFVLHFCIFVFSLLYFYILHFCISLCARSFAKLVMAKLGNPNHLQSNFVFLYFTILYFYICARSFAKLVMAEHGNSNHLHSNFVFLYFTILYIVFFICTFFLLPYPPPC